MVEGIALITVTTIIAMSVCLALMALSRWLADRLERRTRDEMHLTPEQRAMLRALDEQPR